MINNRLPEFNQVAAGKTSLLKIPKYALTLKGLQFRLGGTFTKGMISEARLKIGTSTRSAISGAQLDAINSYKGMPGDALHLEWLLSERDAKDIVAEESGGWDMRKIPDDIYLEVDVSSSATSPTLQTLAWFTAPQGPVTKPDGTPVGQLIQKYVRANFQAPSTGGTRNAFAWDPKGALIKRLFLQYAAGSDWTLSANGNFSKLEVKKNGGVVWEMECLDARYDQVTYKHVPQSRMYVVDFIIDNNLSGVLRTADASALEFNAFVTSAETQVTMIADVLDAPYNL